ncbi:DUF3987 domain-containing protein [Roseiconus nitratireducens]|uniref:DUF3987 domain-containing protein n=1 Tax=Roseiconus nitratireducens TaxID=2605748 RepID=A0A5M6DCZ4_9BACT|nr:DUF3987 domain-containing protein [Roseiconus nitratireducens]KAA5545404.1 DUF3987 domain-containing protein [Roseiconus nitratireducens]
MITNLSTFGNVNFHLLGIASPNDIPAPSTKIPEELRQRRQWLTWDYVDGQKIPMYTDGNWAKTNKPETFHTYEEVVKSGRKIAFVIQADDPYVGVDLDNCLDDDGQLREWAKPIVLDLGSCAYGETSPSGRGIKFLLRGKKPDGARCVFKIGDQKQQIEVYDSNRFWATTGEVYEGFTEIKSAMEGQPVIDWICQDYLMNDDDDSRVTVALPASEVVVADGGNLSGFDAADYEPIDAIDWKEFIDPIERYMFGHNIMRSRLEGQFLAFQGGLSLRERAELYCSKVASKEIVLEGGRNNVLFGVSGHLHAMINDCGSHLSIQEVEAIMLRWNSLIFDPPLDAKEINSTVCSSKRNGTPPKDKPPKPMTVSDLSDVWLFTKVNFAGDIAKAREFCVSRLQVDEKTIEEEQAKFDTEFTIYEPGDEPVKVEGQLPDHLWKDGGFIESMTRHIIDSKMDEEHPEIALCGSLGIMSMILAQRVVDDSPKSTCPNLYVLGIGFTGCGKQAPQDAVDDVVEELGFSESRLPLGDISSKQAVFGALAECGTTSIMLDEAGDLLRDINNFRMPHIMGLSKVFREAFGRGNTERWVAYRNAQGLIVINRPQLTLMGFSTPKQVTNNITREQIENGLIGRFLLLQEHPNAKEVTPTKSSMPPQVAKWLTEWEFNFSNRSGNIANTPGMNVRTIPRSDSAAKRLDDHFLAIRRRNKTEENETARAIWNRASEKTAKLALLFSCSRSLPTQRVEIELRDADRAIATANYLTRRFIGLLCGEVADGEHDALKKRVLRQIPFHPEVITQRDLSRKTQFLRDARQRNEIINELIEAGYVERVQIPGRKTFGYTRI